MGSARRSGTKTSSTATSWLPVPRRPAVCQVSTISNSAFGTACICASFGTPSPSVKAVAMNQSAPQTPLAKGQRPLTRQPPSTFTARPQLGISTPATMASGTAPQISSCPSPGQ